MASSAVKQIRSSRRCAGALSRLAYRRAVRQDIDVTHLLKDAELTKDAMEDTAVQVGVANQIKFVERVADALGDACTLIEETLRQVG